MKISEISPLKHKKSMLKKKQTIIEEDLKDLGFGSKVAQQSKLRLLNPDGSFNVERTGLSFFSSISPYHALLTMPWWKFHIIVTAFFLSVNFIFALGYIACGAEALQGIHSTSTFGRFLEAFYFSVQTITTVGYGHINPSGFAANLLATFELYFGLLTFAVAAGLLFARFSRPVGKIIFSKKAIIAPYHDIKAFEFRIANARNNQLIEVQVKLTFARMEKIAGRRVRHFYDMTLERRKVAFLPLHWTIVHPIEKNSPLYGLTEKDLKKSEAEFLILITATDDTFSQIVHARTSYRFNEIIWGAKFKDMFQKSNSGHISVDLHRLHQYETLEQELDNQ
ncbi:potassium transporter [candidate division KSB1 bacterium]|nr:potassium transporter [candidate division KSB1 bacterium]